jgi:alpha-L-rhamnosidase
VAEAAGGTPRDPVVRDLRAEYGWGDVVGIGVAAPRLSWITTTDATGWLQAAYEVEVDGAEHGRVEDWNSVFVPWPAEPLRSRDRRTVRVRVWGTDGSASGWSEPLAIEAGLLEPGDWTAEWISSPLDDGARPFHLRRAFEAPGEVAQARLHITSAGVHEVLLNGERVGTSVLAPGWTSYANRLPYETHDVTALVRGGRNVLVATVADGWWRGHLGWEMKRNVYGDRIGLLAQLELTYADGTTGVVATDGGWRTAFGPILVSDLYNGETYDARLEHDGWDRPGFDDAAWRPAEPFSPTAGRLVAPQGPPVRRTEELPVREVLTTPSGRTILDFGQNLVGWLRLTVDGPAGSTVTLRHAEVLEHGELGTRPLRNAEATDRYVLRGEGPETWEPRFTFHGFRYAEVDGWPGELDPSAFSAVVIHSDMRPTGTFTCSHELVDQLHRNVVWGMRGNFVSVPTDCPQRDERLGWTGDLQVFAPTAAFLYDTGGFLAGWLEDLAADQGADGAVPMIVPVAPFGMVLPFAAWSDAATIVPATLHERYADLGVVERQFESMRAWVEHVRRHAGEGRLWRTPMQLGDWLDPSAPPEDPGRAKTDGVLVANAYFSRSAQLLADAAALLGRHELADEYGALAAEVRQAFRDEWMAPSGRLSSDSMTAYALAVVFDLYERDEQRRKAAERMVALAERDEHHIATGFVGTPIVLPALTELGELPTAFRLLTETTCPSWLYPVTMGATTIWERWDSTLPDGSINPGEMTSFNHYALGGVADWLHQVVGGLAPAAPGYRELRIAPTPGGGITWARCELRTPYGPAACRWSVEGAQVELEVEVPPNATAIVVRPGVDAEPEPVGSGVHRWTYEVPAAVAASWAADPPT